MNKMKEAPNDRTNVQKKKKGEIFIKREENTCKERKLDKELRRKREMSSY